jgi:hypothetical protein
VAGVVSLFKLSNLGAAAAALCAVHCAALPLLAGGTILGEHWHNPVLEGSLVGVAAVVGYWTLGVGFRRHGRLAPLALLTVGLAILLSSHWLLPHDAGAPAAVLGAALLVAAQFLNRACPAPCCNREEPHSHEALHG